MFGITPYRREGGPMRRPAGFPDMRGVLEEFFNDSFLPAFTTGESGLKADVREAENEFIIEMDLPGAGKDEIKVELADNQITIGMEKKQEVNEEKENYIRRERRYGSCSRSFYIDNVKTEDIKANYDNGVLTVVLPKRSPEKSRREIPIG